MCNPINTLSKQIAFNELLMACLCLAGLPTKANRESIQNPMNEISSQHKLGNVFLFH
ncbi:MAG: hypothetical protein H8D37_01605 [Chloroflexi bacterium]|nr:hypothetical protein [Chloroflexota bacterium]